jgi:hypothetical protein
MDLGWNMDFLITVIVCFVIYVFYHLTFGKTKQQFDDFGRNFLDGKTLEDYQQAHPACFNGKKFIGCHSCGEKSVWMRTAGRTKHGIHNRHQCRHCGEVLWHSTTN